MSFLKARPSRILNLLTALHDKWPDGPSAESWEDWHSEAIEVLQKYLFRLTQPEGLFDPKRPLALTDDYVFPAKEFLELEAALKALVNRHYRSVEEVPMLMEMFLWIIQYEKPDEELEIRKCSYISVLEQLHSISSYFVDHNANMADMRQLVVETGWDQFQGFLIEQLRAKWHNLDIAQQYNLLNDVKSIAMYCSKHCRTLTPKKLSEAVIRALSTTHKFGPDNRHVAHVFDVPHLSPLLKNFEIEPFTFNTVLKSLDLSKTALVAVHPHARTRDQSLQAVVATDWELFYLHLREALTLEEKALRAGQQPMSEVHHDRQVSHEEVLQGFLKDVIKLEYNIVEHGMVARNVWKQFERDFEKAKRENLAPQYEPDKYIYAFLTGALLRESSKFPFPQPRLGWKPEHQHSLAVHHLTRRKQAIYVD